MGILDFFKKKKRILTLHKVELKNCCKNRDTLYDGKICNIYGDINDNSMEEKYYLYTYGDIKVGSFKKSDYNYCENYKYAVIRSVKNKQILAYIICADVYPIALESNFNLNIENGQVVTILQNGQVIDMQTKTNLGTIIDDRIKDIDISNIALAQIDNNKVLTLIYK